MMADGDANYKAALSGGLDARIAAESQLTGTNRVGSGIQVIQPHHRGGKPYDHSSVKLVIDNLIDKMDSNFKPEQYSCSDTFSLVYLNDYNFTLYGLGTMKQKAAPVYFDEAMGAPVSGELWNAAFASLGNLIFRSPEFEGARGIDGQMDKVGILVGHQESQGVIFYVETLGGEEKVAGFFRGSSDDYIRDMACLMSDFHNDDLNSESYCLSK